MTNKSDTPFTDAYEHNMGSVTEPHYVVDHAKVRELERELNDLRAERDEAKGFLKHFEKAETPAYQSIKQELAALKAENERMRNVYVKGVSGILMDLGDVPVPALGDPEAMDLLRSVVLNLKTRSTK